MTGRRHDPQRRERIVDAAIDVVAERGVPGTTARAVAAAADVPLGSVTYHFSGVDELLRLAFDRVATRVHARFDATLAAADPAVPGAAEEAVVRIICDEALGFDRDVLLMIELYVHALRRPEFRSVVQQWMERSRSALRRHFTPDAAAEIDALIEGMILHQHLGTETFREDRVRRAVRRITADSRR
ncbi:TetR/AcrR family transcriptional regulator [Pseudonocardia alni]|uniref:TetR/AcrR family transcriptional regulator n=1 Tax=Pseudonocardia alni TaxID=33907 RepID=UPI00340C2A9E